jgi:hypothetical protein
VEREDSEENVRSGEEYDEMAGVAGTEGEGEEARTAAGKASVSIDCRGSSIGICCGFGFRLECWIGVAAWSLGMFVTLTCGGLCATKSMLPRLSGLYSKLMKGRRFNETCRIDGRESLFGQKGGSRLTGASRGLRVNGRPQRDVFFD